MRDGPNLQILAEETLSRLDSLAAVSETPGQLTRRYLTPEHRRANELVLSWMAEAGMATRVDAMGNAIGRYEARVPGSPSLLFGSHLDTVRNAGRYDGMLGVVALIACVEALRAKEELFDFAIEVIGFGDEEGTRFGATLLGSRAVAGTFDPATLERRDDEGISLAEAMCRFGLEPARISEAARHPDDVLAYVELHIEQGPVLEQAGLPVGIVTAIAGATRLKISLSGMAGHAGTTPMTMRRDALTGAAEAVLAIERLCKERSGVVGTVGRIEVEPGAINVIPGAARFTVDLRAETDEARNKTFRAVCRAVEGMAATRQLGVSIEKTHESGAVACAPWLMLQLQGAIRRQGFPIRKLPSGAGHDAMAMRDLTDMAMLFMRCAGGISHNPTEAIARDDIAVTIAVLLNFIRGFEAVSRSKETTA